MRTDQFGRSYSNDCLHVYTPEGIGPTPSGTTEDDSTEETGGTSTESSGNEGDGFSATVVHNYF